MADALLEAARDLVRREFRRERESNFPTLRRVPSTRAVRFLDFVESLTPVECDELAEGLAARGAGLLLPPVPTPPPAGGVLARFDEAAQWRGFGGGLRYTPVSILAGVAKDAGVGGLEGWCQRMGFAGKALEWPSPHVPGPDSLVPVKATAVRKRFAAALDAAFAGEGTDHGDGLWSYRCGHGGCSVFLSLTFGRRLGDPELRYSAVVGRGGWSTSNLTSYEGLLGAGPGWWDLVTRDNLDPSASLLPELIGALCRLVSAATGSPP